MPPATRQPTFRNRLTALFLFCVLGIPVISLLPAPLHAASDDRLLQIKAAFTYRFLLFTQWPDDPEGGDGVKRIGVVDNRSLATLFEILVSQGTNKDNLQVVFLDHTATAEDFRHCRLLYIPASAEARGRKILQQVNGYPVLTVSDMDSFIELGGMIALVVKRNHIRFAVNRGQAQNAEITFNAQMLKLATYVVEADNEE